MSMVTVGTFTDKGSREINEDSFKALEIGDKKCLVVADGLGGHGKGEVASASVVASIEALFDDQSNIDDFLERAVLTAQENLLEEQRKQHARNEMKTTIVALMLDGLNAKWIHVGDSRLYRFKKNKVKERTLDHSVPQMLVRVGEIKEKQIRNHPDRNRLMKVMGTEWEDAQYEVSPIHYLMDSQAYLLCTDGFWELITEKEMEKLLKTSSTVQEWLDRMAETVKKNGTGKNMDNYTAIAVWIE